MATDTRYFYEDLHFDREAECDWCGKKQKVSICHYGTTHYNRLICPECARTINAHERNFGSPIDYFNEARLQEEK